MKLKPILVSGAAIGVAVVVAFGGFALAQGGSPPPATEAAATPTTTPEPIVSPTSEPTPVATPETTAAPIAPAPQPAAPDPVSSAPAVDPVSGAVAQPAWPVYVPADPQPVIPPQYAGFTAVANPSVYPDGSKSWMLFKGCGKTDTECNVVGPILIH